MYDQLLQQVSRAEALLQKTATAHQWRASVAKQLAYIRAGVASGKRPTLADHASFSMGLLAAREFENQYPELADAIYEVLEQFEQLARR